MTVKEMIRELNMADTAGADPNGQNYVAHTIPISTPQCGCPYKVGDKFYSVLPNYLGVHLGAERFMSVAELTVEEICSNEPLYPILRCTTQEGKSLHIALRSAPHFATREEAEKEVTAYNQRLQKQIDEYVAKYGKEALHGLIVSLSPDGEK